jgi:polyhydroxyalkanoate synthesis repressor PhaR
MVTIKKYSNRRLYDTTRSVYVNLEDLAGMIRAGEILRVLDSKTEEDLTRDVLVQVLLELPGVLEVIPIPLLHRIIRTTGGQNVSPMVVKQLAGGLDLLEAQLAAFEQQFGWPSFVREPPPPPWGSAPSAPPPEDDADDEAPSPPPADPEMDALRQRLADIEARLGRRKR